jgi:cellulose synthase/poly-beta-1,6-N-acetylglucosamine synthase-like glycosyltransferase
MIVLIIIVYWLAMAALSIYGVLGLYTLWQYGRHRHDVFPCPSLPADPPPVTIQLPLYNEPFVVRRLIEAAVHLQYPRHRLQIQVIDDSTDSTAVEAARLVDHYKRKGINISLLHRETRAGYKAGALNNALASATGEFIAIFDADFQPQPDFLQQTIPHFATDERLGIIQTRWGHLNDGESVLTAVQAIALDKHFIMEQTVRHRAHLFPKFNGAGGVWRRACLEDAGGWLADTVCEDLCLSTRALLKGWQFRFLPDVIAPAELPATISAYKTQQARWSKGSSQCLWKYGRALLTARDHSLAARLYALLTMSAYLTHILVILLLLLQIPLIWLDYRPSAWMWLFTLFGIGQPLLFIVGQQVLHRNWLWRLRHLPALLVVAVGMSAVVTRAILQTVYGRSHPFIRTPKHGNQPRLAPNTIKPDWIVLVELFLTTYALAGMALAFYLQAYGSLFFLVICALGFAYVTAVTLQELATTRRPSHRSRYTTTKSVQE